MERTVNPVNGAMAATTRWDALPPPMLGSHAGAGAGAGAGDALETEGVPHRRSDGDASGWSGMNALPAAFPYPSTPPFAPLSLSYVAPLSPLPEHHHPLFEEMMLHLAPDELARFGADTMQTGWWRQHSHDPPEMRHSKMAVLMKAISCVKARTFRARNSLVRAAAARELAMKGSSAPTPPTLASAAAAPPLGYAPFPRPAALNAGGVAPAAFEERPRRSELVSGHDRSAAVNGAPPAWLGHLDAAGPSPLHDAEVDAAAAPPVAGAPVRRMGLHLLAEIAILAKRRVRSVRERAARERRAVAVQASRRQGSALIEAVRDHADRLRQLFEVLDTFRQLIQVGWASDEERQTLMPPNVTDMILQYRLMRDGLDMSRQEWRARLEAAMMLRAYGGWRRFVQRLDVPCPDTDTDVAESLAFLERCSLAHFLGGKKTQSIRRGLVSRGMPEPTATAFLAQLIDDLRAAKAANLLTWPLSDSEPGGARAAAPHETTAASLAMDFRGATPVYATATGLPLGFTLSYVQGPSPAHE